MLDFLRELAVETFYLVLFAVALTVAIRVGTAHIESAKPCECQHLWQTAK